MIAASAIGCGFRGHVCQAGTFARAVAESVQLLAAEILIRVELVETNVDSQLLTFNLHHSFTDGRSVAVLHRELSEVCASVMLWRTPDMPNLRLQHADFAYLQRKWIAKGRVDKQLPYLKRQLDGLKLLKLPIGFPKAQVSMQNSWCSIDAAD